MPEGGFLIVSNDFIRLYRAVEKPPRIVITQLSKSPIIAQQKGVSIEFQAVQ